MRKSVLTTKLSLAYPPISNFDFLSVREEKDVTNYIENCGLYMIAKRPELVFNIQKLDRDNGVIFFSIKQKGKELESYGVLSLDTMNLKSDDLCIEFGANDKEYNFNDAYPYNNDNIDGIKFYDGEPSVDNFLLWLTPERLLFEKSRQRIEVEGLNNWKDFLIYEILYVGKAIKLKIEKRLKVHHALQDILSREYPNIKGTQITHEIALLLFNIEEHLNIETIYSESDLDRLFNLERISPKDIFIDAEKAFVNLLNPNYNEIEFKNYPKSTDGLFDKQLDAYSFLINEDITLYCNKNKIIGSRSDNNYDIISVVDNREVYIIGYEQLKNSKP